MSTCHIASCQQHQLTAACLSFCLTSLSKLFFCVLRESTRCISSALLASTHSSCALVVTSSRHFRCISSSSSDNLHTTHHLHFPNQHTPQLIDSHLCNLSFSDKRIRPTLPVNARKCHNLHVSTSQLMLNSVYTTHHNSTLLDFWHKTAKTLRQW